MGQADLHPEDGRIKSPLSEYCVVDFSAGESTHIGLNMVIVSSPRFVGGQYYPVCLAVGAVTGTRIVVKKKKKKYSYEKITE